MVVLTETRPFIFTMAADWWGKPQHQIWANGG